MEITKKEYEQLLQMKITLDNILSKWGDIDMENLQKVRHDNVNVMYPPLRGEELVKTPDIDILNKYPIEVNSFSTIFQIDLHLISNKVRNIWNTLSQEEKEKAILNAEKFKKYENRRLKEPNLLYYLQDKKYNWKQFN